MARSFKLSFARELSGSETQRMPPEHARSFGGGAVATTLDPIVLIAMAIVIALILLLPRKYVIGPVLFALFLVPVGEQVLLGSLHLMVFRIVIIVGLLRMIWTRITSRKDAFPAGFNSADKAFFWCMICQAAAVVLLFLSTDAVINQSGFLLDWLGGYFLFRFLVRDEEDIYRAVKCLAVVASIVGICMFIERLTIRNVFALIGGTNPYIRNGLVRSKGPFAHELMAGAFGSTVLPLFLALWKNGKAKVIAVFGLVGAMLIAWTAGSSTSLVSIIAGILAIFFWPFRKSMRAVRWGMVFGLISLQLVMKAPVWFLIAHIDLTGGSSNYHRAALIDQFIRHFFDWWLIGVKDSGSWGWDMWDVQNQFVNVGETGGLLAFCLFVAIISLCFSKLGSARKAIAGDTKTEWLLWILGAALFAHVVGFFGVNYFDQVRFAWIVLLAMISAATGPILQGSAASEETEARADMGSLLAPSAGPSRLRASAGVAARQFKVRA